MDKGKDLELQEPTPTTSRTILLEKLRGEMEQVFNRAYDKGLRAHPNVWRNKKTWTSLPLGVLAEVTPLLERFNLRLGRLVERTRNC